jgi:hypothetical protein
MVKVTLEVPESLLADIYIAVGALLQRGQEEAAAEEDSEGRADREHGGGQDEASGELAGHGEVRG